MITIQFQILPIPFVTDQSFGILFKLFLQGVDNDLPIQSFLSGLLHI